MEHQIVSMVLDAAFELAKRPDDVSPTGPYVKLSYRMNEAGLAERIDTAEAVYLYGPELTGSRALDNCFEQGDGREVARALAQRADANPKLMAAIVRDFGGQFPQSWRN